MNFPENSLLGDVSLMSIQGPDAEAFAQSQLMNDVLALPVGHWHWNGWLNAKGRILALFALARVAPGDLLLVLLDEPADALRDGLQRFVFRSKLRLIVRDELGAFAEWQAVEPTGMAADRLGFAEDGSIILDYSTADATRRLRIAPRAGHTVDADTTRRWREADLRHGLPRWRAGHDHGWTPHMLSLDRLKAFSTRKGCYPGQEIVARTHFLGQSKRQAWWLDGDGLQAGQPISGDDGRAVGDIIEATADGRGALAVAALPAAGPIRCGDAQALASPPLTGLARPA
ncbi:MAG: YgfZ/GcvT domain-containing protein [Silanimonas sp.]